MPLRPARPCRRCYRLPAAGSPFCAEHQQPVGWERHQRGRTSNERGYGAAWRAMRAIVLWDEPCCRLCLKAGVTRASEVVDHIVPKAAGGTDERSNLRGLCRECHYRKTGRDRFARKPGRHQVLVGHSPETTQAPREFENGSQATFQVRD